MYEVKAICDKCGMSETQTGNSQYGPSFNTKKSGWETIKIELYQYNKRQFLLCRNCQRELGLITIDEKGQTREAKIETVAGRLFNVLSEIFADQMPSE